MATLATGLLASFDRTGLSPVGFLQVVSPTSFLVPPLPRFSQRDRSVSENSSLILLNSLDHPRMMTKILLYGYCVGVFSSRKIQKRLVEDVAFRVLAAGNQPDFRTISDFRKLHLKALEEMFQQVLRLVLEVGALKLGRVALDGSKVKANASKHKAMSYGRMEETEKRLRKEVQEMLKQAEAVDEEEDKRYGRERQGEELPEELQRRETRIARIQEAKKVLEERAREKAESEGNRKGAKPEP